MKGRSSKLGLIVWLIVGAVIGLTVSRAIRAPRAGASAGSGALMEIDPARAASITVRDADGREVVCRRDGRGGWEALPTGREESAWPAEESAALTALEALADLRGVSSRGAKGAQRRDEAAVIVTMLDGREQRALLGRTPRAGVVTARTEAGRAGTATAALAEALIEPGMRAWRSSAAMPGVGVEATRVALKSGPGVSGQGEVTLEHKDGRWWMTAPVATRADETAVHTLLAALAETKVREFRDGQPSAPAPGAPDSAPWLSIVVETDARTISEGGEARLETRRASLDVLDPPDAGAEGSRARAGGQDVTITSPRLRSLDLSIGSFIRRTPAGAVAADVGGLVVAPVGGAPRTYRRTLDGWVETRSAGTTAPTEGDAAAGAPERAGAIEAAVAFLCAEKATRVATGDSVDAAFQPLAIVTILGFKANPLEIVTIGETEEGLATLEGGPWGGALRIFGDADRAALRGAFTPVRVGAR